MDLSRIPVNKGANSRFGWRKYNYYPPLLTEEYEKGLALFQEQNLEIVVVCLHDQNARRKKKVRDISYDFHYYHVVRISTPHFCDTGKHTVKQIKNVYFPCISVACLLSSKETRKR